MARKRMVAPDLLRSEALASLPIPTRYGFVALILYVDDYGRGVDNAKLIRAHTWPLDDYSQKKVATDLDLMAAAGVICRYTVAESHFLHLPSWKTWQKVAHPTESRIAPCPGHEAKEHADFMKTSRGTHDRFVLDQFRLDESSLGDVDALAWVASMRADLAAKKQNRDAS